MAKKSKKLVSISKLKAKAWKVFSEWIRRKDADLDGNVVCVCCGKRGFWRSFQASHLVPGRKLGILFDERGVYPCCVGCNIFKHGNYREFDAFIDEKFGELYRINLVEDLRRKSKQPTKWSRDQFEEVIECYKNKIMTLKTLEGL